MTSEQMQQASMKAANAVLDVFEGTGRVTSDAIRDTIARYFVPLCNTAKTAYLPPDIMKAGQDATVAAAEPTKADTCPHCQHVGLICPTHERMGRVPAEVALEAEPQVIRKTVWLHVDADGSNPWVGINKPIWADAPPPAIPIPFISRDGGNTWQLDDTAKDAEIARLRATAVQECKAWKDALLASEMENLREENRRLTAGGRDAAIARLAAVEKMVEVDVLSLVQQQLVAWQNHNFPDRTWEQPFMGIVEEVGELSHSLLKQKQHIRGTSDEHEANAKDAIADIIVFVCDLANARGWRVSEIVAETWAKVRQRNWRPEKGPLPTLAALDAAKEAKP